MKVTIFILKKEHQGLQPGFKITLDEDEMNNFDQEKIQSFYSGSQRKTISIDLSDSELFDKKSAERTRVTVKDLLDYLRNCNLESEVHLDHDGWLQDYIEHTNVQELIDKRGIFEKWTVNGSEHLTINN